MGNCPSGVLALLVTLWWKRKNNDSVKIPQQCSSNKLHLDVDFLPKVCPGVQCSFVQRDHELGYLLFL